MARKKLTEIKVHVTSYGAGRNLVMRYRHPKTGEVATQTTGTRNRKEALKLDGLWEEELRNGKFKPASKTTWEEFRIRYENECIAEEMKESTAANVSAKFDALERIINPGLLMEIDDAAIVKLRKELREERITRQVGDKTVEHVIKRTEETIRGHLRVIKAALLWAKKKGIFHEPPEIEIDGATGSKGRPITLEEFERLLSKIGTERPAEEKPAWERFLWGMWWSGLRLEEAMSLTWDDR